MQSASDLDQILLRRGRTDQTLWRPILLKLDFCHGLVDHSTRQDYNIVVKLKDLHGKWKVLKKDSSNMSGNQRSKETAFVDSLDDLFDVAHAEAMKLINIEEDRKFLEAQREKGRRGCIGAVDCFRPAC